MKKIYIQPKLITLPLDPETSILAGSNKSNGGDYTGDSWDPSVKKDTDESDDLGGLPGGDE